MARKQKGQKTPNFSLHAKPSGSGSSKGKRLETYEDTLEPGSTDERELLDFHNGLQMRRKH